MSSKETDNTTKKKNFLEWSVFGLSLLIVLFVIGTLVHQALTVGDEPARLSVTPGDPLVGHGQIRLPLRLENHGDLPAIAVQVEVTGTLAGKELTSSAHFDYIPHRATRAGWVSFPGDRIPADLSARVLGYAEP